MKLYAFLICLLLCGRCISQVSLEYDESGKLVSLKEASGPIVVKIPDGADKKKEARKLIYEKCLKASALLSDVNALEFFKQIWNQGDIDQLKAELEAIGQDAIASHAPYLYLGDILTYLPFPDPVYQSTTRGNRISVRFINVVNKFLIDYHKSKLAETANADIKNLKLKEFNTYVDFILTNYQKVTTALQNARAVVSEVNRLALEQTHAFTLENSYVSIRSLLRKPWFKQWIWYTEGVLRLNPFEFVNSTFYEKFPEYDPQKSGLYTQYIDSILQRRIRFDSTEKLDEVKKLLVARQTSNKEFNFRDRIDKIKAENDASIKGLTTVTSVLNETTFPEDNASTIVPHLYYFADQEFAGSFMKASEDTLCTIKEKKTLAIHNVPGTAKIFLREATTAIEDKSEFGRFTEDVAGQMTSLIPSLKTVAPLLQTFSTSLQTRETPLAGRIELASLEGIGANFSTTYGVQTLSRVQTHDQIKVDLIKYLTDSGYYNAEFLEDLIDSDEQFEDLLNSIIRRDDKRFDNLVNMYLKAYKLFYSETLEIGRADSIILQFLTYAFPGSTLPFSNLTAGTNNKAAYSSVVKKTSVYDNPVENAVRVVAINGKDSLTLSSFKYKMVKRHWFQITGGIAVSFPSPVQNKVTTVNGAQTITQEKESVRPIVGVNFYLGKGMVLQDTRVTAKNRISLMAAVGFPQPLKNIYTGISWDIIPSVRLIAGTHFHNVNEYTLKNGQVAKSGSEYKIHGFAAIGIDPVSFVRIFNLFQL